MIINNKHIIQTLRFETQVSNEATAHAFADKLSAINCESLLNKVLSRFDTVTETIRIDRLELDIGQVELDDIDMMSEEIIARLEDALNSQLTHARTCTRTSDSNKIFNTAAEPGKELPQEDVESVMAMILHYLTTGSLPWNITERPNIEKLLVEILQKDTVKWREKLLPELRKWIVIKRLATIFSLSTIELLVEKIVRVEEFGSVKQISVILKGETRSLPLADFERELVTIYLKALHESFVQQKTFTEIFISGISLLLQPYSLVSLRSMLSGTRRLSETSIVYKQSMASGQFREKLEKLVLQKEQALTHSVIDETDENKTLPVPESKTEPLQKDQKEKELAEEQDISSPEDEELSCYFIDNAGLVLLNAALLQKSFERFGWIKEKKVTDESSRHKMILWLDYLIWGERKTHEYGLTLNKVLMGLHPADVCDIHISLTEVEKSAADELLKTVIDYWTILKNTGIESLRTTFLQRKGRLSNEDGGWQLHVEAKGFDILIDSLPWTFSIIKFPWMEKPLFTQWQTKV